MLLSLGQIVRNHLNAHFLCGDFWHPAEFLFCFAGVSQQGFDFGGAEVAGIDADDGLGGWIPGQARDDIFGGEDGVADFINALALPGDLHTQLGGGPFDELAHAVLHASGDDKVLGLVLLQHHPLHAHVVFGVAPVTQGVDVAHVKAVFQPLADVGQSSGDLAGDEGFATAWAFVVEQDAVAGVNAIRLAVVDGDPVGVHFGHSVGAAGVKRRGFFLGRFLHQAIKFACTGLVEARFLF